MNKQSFSFEQIPSLMAQLIENQNRLEGLILNNQKTTHTENHPDQFLTIQEASNLLGLSVPTLYSKVSRSEVPVMKRGNRLYFSKTELIEYLKAGKRKTSEEIEAEANFYLSNKKVLHYEK